MPLVVCSCFGESCEEDNMRAQEILFQVSQRITFWGRIYNSYIILMKINILRCLIPS